MALYDAIVIGAGIEGWATAANLGQSCQRVLVLEQFPLPHNRGSSNGQTRITRLAYRDPVYVRLMVDAHKKWRILERETQLQLLRKTGILLVGDRNLKQLIEYESALRIGANEGHRIPAEELRQKFGHQLTAPECDIGLWEGEGGLLYNQRCLQAYTEQARARGVEIKDESEVTKILPGDTVSLQTADGKTYHTKSLVICAGPWAAELLQKQLNLHLPIVTLRTFSLYWRETESDVYSAMKGTPVILFRDKEHTAYFKPSLEYRGLVQFGVHHGSPSSPSVLPKDKDLAEYIEMTRQFGMKYKLKLDLTRPVLVEPCFYSESLDANYFLDTHPQHRNIVIGTGFTGHGFKMAPIVGEILYALATGRDSKYDIKMFKIDRFPLSDLAKL